jgi:catechol 2,3-dioxygenase-like lactoylglutathione lyase family enzyme
MSAPQLTRTARAPEAGNHENHGDHDDHESWKVDCFERRRGLNPVIEIFFMMQGIAKKTCDVLSMISSFHSVLVEVADFESGVADYARLLGQKPGPIENEATGNSRSVFYPLGNMLLEIREASAPNADRATGLKAIRLACDDLAEIAERFDGRTPSLLPSENRKAVREGGTERAGGEPLRTWVSTPVDPTVSRSLAVELISDEVGSPESSPDLAGGVDTDSRVLIRGLDHVVVMSADIEATRDFYGDGLGIRLALDRSFEKRGVRLVFFRIAGVTIEIGGRLDAPRDPQGRDRFGGLAWQVVDIDAIHSRLSADGFDVSDIRDGHKAGTRVCTVREPVHDVPTLLIEPVS